MLKSFEEILAASSPTRTAFAHSLSTVDSKSSAMNFSSGCDAPAKKEVESPEGSTSKEKRPLPGP